MIVEVRVKLGSKHPSQVRAELDGSLLIYVHEPPVDGKANQAVIASLAKHYKVSKSRIELIGGQKSKQKRFLIS